MGKTLLLINSRFLPLVGGGETYVLELMQHFSSTGWDVHLATRSNGIDIRKWHDCTIHYVDGFDDDDQRIHLAGPGLRKVLDAVKPDVVHVHNLMPYFAFASISEPKEFPVVLTIHNTPHLPVRLFGSFKDFESERVFTRQLLSNGKYDKLLMGSQYYLDSYAEVAPWIKTDGKSEVAYYFPPRLTTGPLTDRTANLDPTRVKLLFPSRILERKGIEDCLAALASLPKNFTLSLPAYAATENKAYQDHIHNLIESLGLADRVELPSEPASPAQMVNFFEEADIVVIPSHYEGFGIVAVEAMSWGLPVVATNVGGLGEIVLDGVNGLSVPPKNPAAIADAVRRLVSDDALRRSLVEKAIVTARDQFSRAKHMQQIEAAYAGAQ